jgi:heme exporter protein D
VLVIFWVRGTFPRLRIDQLMAFAWKALVPLSFYAIVITAVCQFYGWPAWSLTLMSLAGLAGVGYLVHRRFTAPARRVAQVRARQQAAMQTRRPRAPGVPAPAPQPASIHGPGQGPGSGQGPA